MADERRNSILDAAIAVIAQRGVRGLRVEEVAAQAAVAVSLLYYYFETRNGLVRAALEHANERAIATGARTAARGRGLAATRRTLLAEFDAGNHVRDTSVVWGEVLASAVFEPDLREQLRAASDAWVSIVAEQIRAGQQDGSIRTDRDADGAAQLLTATVDGLSARWLAGLITRQDARRLLAEAITATLEE